MAPPWPRSSWSSNRTLATQDPPPTHRVRLTIGYAGPAFAGWARQPAAKTRGRPTVQGALERALADVLGHPVDTVAAGRTDAGVHAAAQVVSFDATTSMPAAGLTRALAARLPDDLWIVDASYVGAGFHARYEALRRWYRYAIWRGAAPPPGWRGRCLAVEQSLDVAAMRRASRALLGRRDMAALEGQRSRRTDGRGTIRTVYVADWLEAEGGSLLVFEVCADAFLRQMVRTMVGSLLWVGRGRWSSEDLERALATGDRRAAGPAAPAHGLTLWRIEYDDTWSEASRAAVPDRGARG